MKQLSFLISSVLALQSFGQIQLNEMQSSNNSTLEDEFGEFDDWVEIQNTSAEPIDIGGLVLKDQLDTWSIPTGNASTLLAPGGLFLLWADDQEFQGVFHTNFKLASGGEFLGLYANDGITVIDSITLPGMAANDSFMRCNSEWQVSNNPTPLQENECSPNSIWEEVVLASPLVIYSNNEKQLNIELFSNLSSKYQVSLYSMTGKKLLQTELNKKVNTISLRHLISGVYIAAIYNDTSSYSERIIVK